jgi:hypothetical protein
VPLFEVPLKWPRSSHRGRTRVGGWWARHARDVLDYHNHDGDREGGDFKRNLITAIISAGLQDRARLALGFPSLVAAIRSQTSNPSQPSNPAGIEYLEGIARSYERPLA